MVDISQYTYSKGTQTNADDLVAAPRTVVVTDVVLTGDEKQPLAVRYEGDEGKPFLPCLTMRKMIAAIWGKESDAWIGQSLTLFRDPSIKFGPDTPGGVRISHMSGIDKTISVQLLEKRGKRRTYTIVPLVVEKAAVNQPVKQSEPVAESKAHTIDRDALFSDARENAALGRKDFGKWFKTKTKPEQDALKEIGAEVTELLDAAEAPPAN